MGFLSKIFKPVSKVLDKIIPNEAKPFLPYAAAFAPMFAPGIMGLGGGSMLSRGLISGGLNLGSQLAQEGSEGDFNPLSVLMAGGIGALSAPGTSSTTGPAGPPGSELITTPGTPSAGEYLSGLSDTGSFGDKGLEFLAKGADKLSALNAAGVADPFSSAGLKASVLPFAQATGDLAYADAQRALRDFEDSQGGGSGYAEGDQNRGLAVRRAMERGGHEEQTIQDMLESLGYADPDPQELAYGGRVNAMGGGIMSNQRMNFAGGGMDAAEPDFGGMPRALENVKTAQVEEVSEIVELDDLSKLEGFAEMLSNMDESDPKYNEIRNMGIAEAEMVGEKYQISPVNLVGYLDTKTDMFKEKTTEDNKKEVLMESIKNTSFGFADGGVTSVLPEGMEMDYRGGGFIPMGSKERADDVPARVSKNEFVMTADAVRAAGGGSVNQGAKKMYELMNNLEAKA